MKRFLGTRGRPPQQDEPDWEDRDGAGGSREPAGPGEAAPEGMERLPPVLDDSAAPSRPVACSPAYRVVAELEGRA